MRHLSWRLGGHEQWPLSTPGRRSAADTPWPNDRQNVPLGHIVIDQVGPNSPEADRSLAFMPGSLPPGIEFADPMLTIRNASYPHSFQERNS